jgi:glutaredoxin 3
MTETIIYTTDNCPYCLRAKALLQRKNINFTEIKVSDEKIKEKMIKKSGGRLTVPQIFIGKKHIGGYDDLHDLELRDQLDILFKVTN